MQRLSSEKIFCVQPPRISVSGRVNIMVFDKTGTLTEDNLDIHGFNTCELIDEEIKMGPFIQYIEKIHDFPSNW